MSAKTKESTKKADSFRGAVFSFLRRLLYLWVRSTAIPKTRDETQIHYDPSRPVCYILRSRSLIDLLILDFHCETLGLPRPLVSVSQLGGTVDAGHVYLFRTGWFQRKRSRAVPTGLLSLVRQGNIGFGKLGP